MKKIILFYFLFQFLILIKKTSLQNAFKYEDIFKPCKIGNLEVPNHFIRSSTLELLANNNGVPNQRSNQVYIDLMKGNVGTIISSPIRINSVFSNSNIFALNDDCKINYFKEMTDLIHSKSKSKILFELVYLTYTKDTDDLIIDVLGPSSIRSGLTGYNLKEMNINQIKKLIKLFGEAALRSKQANADGVQIHAAHNSLLAEFLSPLVNKRNDQYGGSVENRLRIVIEILKEIKRVCGKDFPVWIKINSSDEIKGGLNEEDSFQMCMILSKEGIDAIEITGGKMREKKENERIYYKDFTYKVAQNIKTPVIIGGGIRTKDDINEIISNSNVRFFAFSRPLFKDPYFLNSLK